MLVGLKCGRTSSFPNLLESASLVHLNVQEVHLLLGGVDGELDGGVALVEVLHKLSDQVCGSWPDYKDVINESLP